MARDYGKVSPQFWTGKTGKSFRGDQEAQIVALYLMTSPHSNMIGVFSLPLLYVCHETGLPLEGASKGLSRCIEGGFCTYCDDSEVVFVHGMAAHQVGTEIKAGDLRLVGVRKQYAQMAEGRIKSAFHALYGNVYDLQKPDKSGKGLARGFKAPTKPGAGTGAGTGDKKHERQAARFPEFWEAYPVKKGKTEAQAKWKSRNLDAIADRIIADVKARMAGDRQWKAGYVPHGSTYVNGSGWEDEIQGAALSGDVFGGAL